MITSETFYRAECEHEKCSQTIPDPDDHEASHWPLVSVEEYLREPHEHRDVEVTWFYDGVRTFCPEHHPDARACSNECNGGMVQVPGVPPNWPADREWTFPHHWENCPECHGVGFHPAPSSADPSPEVQVPADSIESVRASSSPQHPTEPYPGGSMRGDPKTEAVADKLARALDGNGGDDLGLAEGEGALHLALDYPIREAIEDVYADCGDSTPSVLSTNIAQRLAYLLPKALIEAFPSLARSSGDPS